MREACSTTHETSCERIPFCPVFSVLSLVGMLRCLQLRPCTQHNNVTWILDSAAMHESESKYHNDRTSKGKRHQELTEETRQLETEVDLLRCEANSRKVWLRHRLEVDQDTVVRIRSMEENAGKDLEAMTGRLEAADAELKLLAERLQEKELQREEEPLPKFEY